MPKAFDNCVKSGGRVRTKSLSGGRYKHICFIGGKSYAGHTKKRKTTRRRVKATMKRALR